METYKELDKFIEPCQLCKIVHIHHDRAYIRYFDGKQWICHPKFDSQSLWVLK